MKYIIKSASQFEVIGVANTLEEAEAIAEQYEMNNTTDEAVIKEKEIMIAIL